MMGFLDGLIYSNDLVFMVQYVNFQIFDVGFISYFFYFWGLLSFVDFCLFFFGFGDGVEDLWFVVFFVLFFGESQSFNLFVLFGQLLRYVVIINVVEFGVLFYISDFRMSWKMDGQYVIFDDFYFVFVMGEDVFVFFFVFGVCCMSGEGEFVWDYYFYKNVYFYVDGFFYCFWEGQLSCNYKFEKFKCNYE